MPEEKRRHTILVVDDEPDVISSVKDLLRLDYHVLGATRAVEGMHILATKEVHVVMTDQRMPGTTGVEFLRHVRGEHPAAIRLLFTGYADLKAVIDAINRGNVYRYITKPWDPDELMTVIREACERYDLIVERERLLAEITEKNAQLERAMASLVHYAHDAILAWTPEGSIVSWNPGAEQLFGVTERDALASSIEILVPKALVGEFRARTARIAAGENVPVVETYRLRGDREVEVEESLFLAFDAKGQRRIGCIAREVGELLRLRRATEILGGADPSPPESQRASKLSTKMQTTIASADIVAEDAHATVLLLGETGVGKSWFARRIHRHSPRHGKPLFEVNCASLSPQLVESELFGHERGAFTGALSQKRGIVEVAEGGTVFLDEIGELPLAVQGQLLTFLDTKTFRRVGGTLAMTADVRLIAATNVDLKQAAERGAFRRDLYYRLSVVPIEVPPLRERRVEIPEIARRLLADLSNRTGKPPEPLDPAVTMALSRYEWPGNVRELKNALERALILSRGQPIRVEHLPPEMRPDWRAEKPVATSTRLEDLKRAHTVLEPAQDDRARGAEILGLGSSSLHQEMDALERQRIVDALERCAGNQTHAAQLLGLSRGTLLKRLEHHQLPRPRGRRQET